MLQAALGAQLLGPGGAEVSTTAATAGKKAVALYFSAHWCPPCRGFTPKLAKWYSDDLQGKGLEVVFVSSDRDEASFSEYFADQPWLALPFADRDAKARLSSKFEPDELVLPTLALPLQAQRAKLAKGAHACD